MRKLGKFRGLPVYALTENEWQTMTTKDEETFYVVNSNVYYHDIKVARLNEYGQLAGLDEDEIISLRKKWEAIRAEKAAAEARPVATFRSAAEEVKTHSEIAESPVKDAGDAPAAIDQFIRDTSNYFDDFIKNAKMFDTEVADVAVG